MFKAFCDECGSDVETVMPNHSPDKEYNGRMFICPPYKIWTSVDRTSKGGERITAHLCLDCIGKMAAKAAATMAPA